MSRARSSPNRPASERRSSDGLRERLQVRPGQAVDLDAIDAGQTLGRRRESAHEELAAGLERLSGLQDRIWAEQKHAVLVILQGIDASGKDGTIRHVMGAFNPQGCRVTSFKVPTEPELAHDYLWRVHQHTPGRGEIAIFNRSQYEDVLVVRVKELVPETAWRRRFAQINDFERMLTEEGTTVVKFFLHIDRDEQRERFQARLDDPSKRWKFRRADLDERLRWDDYIAAFEEALSGCSTKAAPWFVVPANKKWFRNLAVAEILAGILEELEPRYPEPEEDLEGMVVS